MERQTRRRTVLAGLGFVVGFRTLAEQHDNAPSAKIGKPAHVVIPDSAFEAIEVATGGELGAFVLDTQTGRSSGWKADQRAPLNSTFKLLLAAVVLRRAEMGHEDLMREVPVRYEDIVVWSPVLKRRIGTTMTVGDLCAVMMTRSDNTAANLLLRSLGGPAALTETLRDLGDPTTRIDRFEPDLNDAPTGDVRDTTTPERMVRNLEYALLGGMLSEQGRSLLWSWMVANTTGTNRLRAGVPDGWTVGDRTGTGPRGETSTVAAVIPPNRKPLLMAIYIRGSSQSPAEQSRWHADLARIATSNLPLLETEPHR